MSRFLFVVPPLAGHINPTIGVGAELLARRHSVAWAGFRHGLEARLPQGARLFPVGGDIDAANLRAPHEQWLQLRGTAELKFFWEDFLIPLADVMLPGVQDAITEFEPDVVVCDQQALAGPLAARRAGRPWVTSASTSSEITRPLAAMPKVDDWVRDCMTQLQRRNDIGEPVDLRWSEDLVLVFSTQALTGPIAELPEHVSFVGPAAVPADEEQPEFPWDWLDPARRTVLASLGTLNAEAGVGFYRTLIEAVGRLGEPIQLVVVAPPELIPDPPEHVLVRRIVPQRALLPRVAAVVSHGGHNTVCEALTLGIPLVVAPIRDDQPIIAQQVADAGAGVRVSFARVRATALADALGAVLDQETYRAGARRIAESFATAGGAGLAADRLVELVAVGAGHG
ncbi:glycosyltransferase family 1 protein [Skermania sp. ID1734]|uniref:glycosyltransferase n=1 Tax=Skermania sp. ID1734 TaxID=2597516 RepID=UPI00117D6793|nr:glycosyltransferase [Skermania sp. ID1734]TSE01109.1 glycosyltransferase family 1 protein [Skermania sp. ID1734]